MRAQRLRGGIIAAGEGSRLRQAGFPMPKPLVPIAGLPLIGWVIRNFVAAGIIAPVTIVNERAADCVEWVTARFPHLGVRFIVKTTRSSLESFVEVATGLGRGRALISTVDAWCRSDDFVRFVEAARRRPPAATVLAVTPFVADEHPLWVGLDARGRVTRLGGTSGDMVTAGIYLVSERVRTTVPPPGLGRLREFLAWLVDRGEPLYGEVIERVVDVDRAEDVALAEALASTARVSRRSQGGADE
ncbi:MAG: NTP transferase domain-containing protein [Candidatus Rokubacteria bacterium]|nr:NTP transferase domain-containing protein [Candidatus Rokubacteria bacterium]